jgi:hypothetical protein
MYFPRNWEFGSALSKLRIFGGGGLYPPNPPRYANACMNTNEDYICRNPVSVLTYLPGPLSRHHYKCSLLRQTMMAGMSFWQRILLPITLPHHRPTSPSTEMLFKISCDSLKSIFLLLYFLRFSIFFYPTGFQPLQLFRTFPIPVHARVALFTYRNQMNVDTRYEPAPSNLCMWC